jgi:hypothetical protein
MNPIAMLNAAQRANAAYVSDLQAARAAFAALNMTFVSQYRNDTHQAVISTDIHDRYYLTISGTRYSQENNIDLVDDIWLAPEKAAKGGVIPAGVNQGMQEFWNWVLQTVPAAATINVEGHSLGAERTLLTPLFLAKERIGDLYAFEPPQCGTQEFWDAYRDELKGAVVTVCGGDIWFGWPPRQGYVHDAQSNLFWLLDQHIEIILPNEWTGATCEADHAITEVIARIQSAITNGTFPHVL